MKNLLIFISGIVMGMILVAANPDKTISTHKTTTMHTFEIGEQVETTPEYKKHFYGEELEGTVFYTKFQPDCGTIVYFKTKNKNERMNAYWLQTIDG